jgi:hypothetical protein
MLASLFFLLLKYANASFVYLHVIAWYLSLAAILTGTARLGSVGWLFLIMAILAFWELPQVYACLSLSPDIAFYLWFFKCLTTNLQAFY